MIYNIKFSSIFLNIEKGGFEDYYYWNIVTINLILFKISFNIKLKRKFKD